MNVDSEELISQSFKPLGKAEPLDLGEIEAIIGVGISAVKRVQDYVLK